MDDYRLLLNRLLRFALNESLSSHASIGPYAAQFARTYCVNGKHALTAIQIALSLAKSHPRRLRKGLDSPAPFVRKLFLRADDDTFHFDPVTGKLRLSLRYGEWTSIRLNVSQYHRSVLSANGALKQVTLTRSRAIFAYEKEAREPYVPKSLIAFDTNESSLDGVHVTTKGTRLVRVAFPDIPRIQLTHFARRRLLGRKKSHDRRLARRLLGREGRRERHRVKARLHVMSRQLVDMAERRGAAIALEDLTRWATPKGRRAGRERQRPFLAYSRSSPRSPRLRRRLSSWPRKELHRQIFYKAEERGVPIIMVNPRYTSQTCPRCGVRTDRRSRMGPVFDCANCGWSMDRQLNAGLNIGMTALRETKELGGLRLALDALPQDVVRPLYASEGRLRDAQVERRTGKGTISAVRPLGGAVE